MLLSPIIHTANAGNQPNTRQQKKHSKGMGLLRRDTPQEEPFASGNIAQVLRQARASLKDPSRPFTPTERRLRSTKSLFGEAGFRPKKIDKLTGGNESKLTRRPKNRPVPNLDGSLKKRAEREIGTGRRSNHLARPICIPEGTSNHCFEAGRVGVQNAQQLQTIAPEGTVLRPFARLGWARGPGNQSPVTNPVSDENVLHRTSDHPCSPHQPPVSSASLDLGILYLDEGCPCGSTSRSIVKQWNTGGRNSSSDSSSCSGRKSPGNTKASNRKATRKAGNAPSNRSSAEYEGLYSSDDDVDTTTWDLGSEGSSVSDSSIGEECPTAVPGPSPVSAGGYGGSSEIDFILDAIDNEIDLSGKGYGLGFDSDNNDSLSGRTGRALRKKKSAADGDDRDASPDPGALEGQRDRNARLTGLLRMLAQYVDPFELRAAPEGGAPVAKAGNLRPDGGRRHHPHYHDEHTKGGNGCRPRCIARALDVLLRVLDRPQGLADASPPSITEFPTLLAGRLVVHLVMPSLSAASPPCGEDGDDNSPSANGGKTLPAGVVAVSLRSEYQQLLMKACRRLFEVSKQAGADEAFFASGAAATLLELAEIAASGFDSIEGDRLRQGGGRTKGGGRRGGGGGRREWQRRRVDADDTNTSSQEVNSDSSDRSSDGGDEDGGGGGDDDCPTRRVEYGLDDGGGHIWDDLNSLTFAVGSLKNVSAGEDLRDRFVQMDSIRKLCKLARSVRELCRRCDKFHKERGTGSLRRSLFFEGAEPHFSGVVVEGGDTSTGEFQAGKEGESGEETEQNPVAGVRRRVSPLLAQVINLLRDFAIGDKGRSDRFREAGAISLLCSIVRPFRHHQDVVLNAARTLAKLSLQQDMRMEISSDPGHTRDLLTALTEQGRKIDGDFGDFGGLPILIRNTSSSSRGTGQADVAADAMRIERRRRQQRRLQQHWEKQGKCVSACVRIAFVLGNLTTSSDENRRLIGCRFGGAESLPALLQTCSQAHLASWECLLGAEAATAALAGGFAEDCGVFGSGRTSLLDEECWERKALRRACHGLEEMLVKTVRLLANISIHREVGQLVCRHPGLVALEPLVGKCLDLLGRFEDGTLPRADRHPSGGRCRSRSGGRHHAAGRAHEAAIIPGEELLLNAVSLVTNLSFYGPGASNLSPSSGHAAPNGARVGPSNSPTGGCSGSTEFPTPATVAGRSHVRSTLFVLASKARWDVDEQEEGHPACFRVSAGGTTAAPSAGIGTPERCDDGDNDEGGEVVGDREHLMVPTATSSPFSRPSNGTGADCRMGCDVLCGQLVKVLLYPNVEAVAEAARAFGNFSRDPSCRKAMVRRRADEVLVVLLGHSCREVVFAAAGALVNIATDPACKVALSCQRVGAGERLARLVRRAGLADPSLAELACQALHNLLIGPLPAGGMEEILGGPDIYEKLWWTLKELIGVCSCQGSEGEEEEKSRLRGGGGNVGARSTDARSTDVVVRGGEQEESGELGGFPAAAGSVWRALNEGRADCDEALFDDEENLMV